MNEWMIKNSISLYSMGDHSAWFRSKASIWSVLREKRNVFGLMMFDYISFIIYLLFIYVIMNFTF